MAANFWESSHGRHWLLHRSTVLQAKREDFLYITDRELVKLNLHYTNYLHKLGKKLGVRQQVVATAYVYFKRFFIKNAFRNTDPLLVAATCMYLACKIEECPHHIKNVVAEMRNVVNDTQIDGTFPYDASTIAEFEFYLMEDLDFYMIVYHPYRPLTQYLKQLGIEKSCLQAAWFIVNDAFKTDAMLLYPPHMISLTAIFMSCVMNEEHVKQEKPQLDVRAFFSDLNINMEEIACITQEILDLWQVWAEYDDAQIKPILDKLRALEAPPPAITSSAP
ncbi:hypothetical protein SmJEL517_g04080 [Synchytrium microbalum]|uniref:Cyclin-like domain-containing protein n=1 Tax=Synchytrium microbalum TaxID=1806994 RepID=A0A507BZP9_9FUNG|nr:uncharacterized protein SmJEL517_g04080 [Synchytrium microbalum]TPX32912.1 hypothetical protein SmJEL517_g04080 [Synchytrium microbalum]